MAQTKANQTVAEPSYEGGYVHVHVNAEAVHDNGNGTFTLKIRGHVLSVDDQETLERLFPNSDAAVGRLLNTEALIQSQATNADMMRPRTPKASY